MSGRIGVSVHGRNSTRRRHGWNSRVEVLLVDLVVGDLADGGERLQRRAVGVVGLRRVEDDPVVARHLAQHVRLAVVGLGEAARDARVTWPRLTVLIQYVMPAR